MTLTRPQADALVSLLGWVEPQWVPSRTAAALERRGLTRNERLVASGMVCCLLTPAGRDIAEGLAKDMTPQRGAGSGRRA